MDKKSSMSRIERQKREKVLRFSIRKYSFGAASVAVAALMFWLFVNCSGLKKANLEKGQISSFLF